MINFYNLSVKEALARLHTDPEKGLSKREVETRRKKYGKNIINVEGTPLWQKLLEPFADLFMIILIIALVLSIIQQSWMEVAIIALDIVLDALTFYIQRFSTERLLRSLSATTEQKVTVLRSGERIELDSSEIVPGDIVFLNEGDRIPADGRIINESGLLTNESMLTGESESIAKDAKAISGNKKVYERRNMVFSGSFVITGSARMLVVATGNETEYGRIASLASGSNISSPIQDKINKLVVRIAIAVLSLAAIIFVIQLLDGIDFFSATKFTLAMIVSAVPEDLPIVTAIILALGARRLAKRNALVKELRAIQSIGIVTTIASDKTGTLTENRLAVQEIWSPLKNETLLKDVARTAILNSTFSDPLDTAILEYVKSKKSYLAEFSPVKSYAFDQDLKISGNLFETKNGSLKLLVKGAPETVIARCRGLSRHSYELAEAKLHEFSSNGYKVIAIATANLNHEINELSRLEKSDYFTFVGFVAVADSVRKEAVPAIAQAATAGVKVKMVTGDHAETAFAIGKKLGLVKDFNEVLDCSKLGSITDDDLALEIQNISVFARVTPEDKHRILNVIKKSEIVAMTGDGVNDVPALTNAHIGIAMGNSSPIVQDAGDIVLIDNNFATIIDAMKEGRIILANIRRMLIYLLATNAGEVLTILGGLIFSGAQLLLPIQILWVNMVTDSLMVIPIGLEPPERHFLEQRPEKKDAPILSRYLLRYMAIISIIIAAVVLGVYYYSAQSFSHDEAVTLAFISLVTIQWANALNVRGIHESVFKRLKVKNRLFIAAFFVAISLQFVALLTPLSSGLGLVPVPALHVIVVTLISFITPILTVEIYKKIFNK